MIYQLHSSKGIVKEDLSLVAGHGKQSIKVKREAPDLDLKP